MLSVEATYEIAETCLCLHVQTAGRVVARHVDHVFRPLGLTNGQFAMLLTLHQAAPVPIGDLAERLTMDPSTATANLKPLERRGLVVSRSQGARSPTLRFVLDQDRLRLIGLSPTEAAQQLQFLLTGVTVTQVREDIRTLDLVARSAGSERLDPARLADFTLTTSDGRMIPLEQIGPHGGPDGRASHEAA